MDKHSDIIPYTANIIGAICSNMYYKCLFAASYVAFNFSFGVNQKKALVAILVLVIIDFVTGVAAAKFSGEEIRSGKIFRSATKALIYFIFIAAANITGIAFPLLQSIAGETVIAFLAVTELISVIENIGKLGFAVPQKLLNKLESIRDEK